MERKMVNEALFVRRILGNATPPFLAMKNHFIDFTVIIVLLAALWYFRRRRSTYSNPPFRSIQASVPSDVRVPSSRRQSPKPSKPTQWYRELFFKLQNLEDHADVLPSARDELLAMFSRSISLTIRKPKGGIFRIENYDAKKIESFMEEEHKDCLEEWERYLKRREQGSAPELFGTVEAAKAWLLQQAPVKFVDGAWLAHLHKVTTPFGLRGVTKNAWQVLSEELGDGDLSKHHVYLYNQLLKDVGQYLPEGYSTDFIKPQHWGGKENRSEWIAAVGQLLISLFPYEFLPEILGFNMHYELITMDTLRANHELKALGINPYYFLIHIVIDNADSGHTAMAVHTVTRYLNMIREKEGEAAVQHAWKRVQVGYTMSQTLGDTHSPAEEQSQVTKEKLLPRNDPLDPLSARIVNIFRGKATVSHQFHCQSRVRLGGQTLADWLAPSTWKCSDPERGLQLLTSLSQAKPWIIPGASSKSLLMRELAWEGRMFGAFTHDEAAALGTWIDALGEGNALLYWNFTRREPLASKDAIAKLKDPTCDHPVVMPSKSLEIDIKPSNSQLSDFQMTSQPLPPSASTRLPDLIALWFAHIGLLENTINAPARTANQMYAHLICLLRAQAGFAEELPIVAGMDEFQRLSCPSLIDIGHELIFRAGWKVNANPESLHDVLHLTARYGQGEKSRKLAHDMLDWATRPSANTGLLMGLALAFLDMKEAVAGASELLTQESRCVLKAIVARERQSLEGCARELQVREESQYRKLIIGYRLGRRALEDLCAETTS